MFRKTILFLAICALSFSSFYFSVQAAEKKDIKIDIFVQKQFKEGDKLNFSYKIISSSNQKISFIPSIECADGNIPQLFPKEITENIFKNSSYQGSYEGVLVSSEFPAQKCAAVISLIKPYEKIFKSGFLITTKPKINAHLIFCTDSSCAREQEIFIKNKPVFIDYSSRQKIPAKAIITSPSGKIATAAIPCWYSFQETGENKVAFIFNSPGFQPIKEFKVINVVEKRQISSSVCKVDGQCVSPENAQNCPQDCVTKTADKSVDYKMILAILTIIISIIIVITYFVIKKRNNKNQFDNTY